MTLDGGASAATLVPAGASTGRHEAIELRDGGERYGGRGVSRAVGNVTSELAPAVRGMDVREQEALDERLVAADGTPGCGRLGANAVLAVSIAAALAGAAASGEPVYRWFGDDPLLPMPMVNVISGGAHADGLIDVQDLLVVPVGAGSFAQALEWSWRVRSGTAAAMQARGMHAALIADEGGLAGPFASNRQALEILVEGMERAGLEPGPQVAIAVDVASGQLCSPDGYRLASEGRTLSSDELIDELASWCESFPVVSLEDVVDEDDWDAWATATRRLGGVQLLGDDLFVTDPGRLATGVEAGAANAILIKPNQAGTLTGARRAVEAARAAGYATVLSARSGDTEDAWLADLGVGWRTGQIKVGSTMRSERTAKWNRLLEVEAALQASGAAPFAGASALAPLSGPHAKV